MAKRRSKKRRGGAGEAAEDLQVVERGRFGAAYRAARGRMWQRKQNNRRVQPHRSFRRSYREDYRRKLEVPGLLAHAMQSLQMILKNWRLFVPLVLLATVSGILLVGLMSQETYQQFQETIGQTAEEYTTNGIGAFAKAGLTLISIVSTGGLSQGLGEVEVIFAVVIFLVTWLVTVYLLRQILAGNKVKLRDGLYNALTPLLSTGVVFAVALVEVVPILIVVVVYSAAVTTEFLATPFYALVFFIFAAALVLLSLYLLSSSVMALVAVTAPGLYPVRALGSAADLVMGRRVKFIIRLLFLIFVVAVIYVVVMLPVILLDMWLGSMWDWVQYVPFTSFCLLLTTMFCFVYAAAYLYLYYRRMLDYDQTH